MVECIATDTGKHFTAFLQAVRRNTTGILGLLIQEQNLLRLCALDVLKLIDRLDPDHKCVLLLAACVLVGCCMPASAAPSIPLTG